MNSVKLERMIGEWERYPLAIFSAMLTYLTPIPSAYLVGTAVINDLQWYWLVGVIAAVSIEMLGIVSVSNALNLWRWNKNNTLKKDEQAPTFLANASVVAYLAIVILLTVMLDVVPHLGKYSNAIWPLLAIISAGAVAIRVEQNKREEGKENEAGEKSMKKRESVVNRKEAAVNRREGLIAEREAAVTTDEGRLVRDEATLVGREAVVATGEGRLADIEARETAVVQIESAMGRMNQTAYDTLMMIGGNGDTGAAIAARNGVSAGLVSGLKSKLNGGR